MQGMKRMVKNTVTPGVHARDEENDKEHSHTWGTYRG